MAFREEGEGEHGLRKFTAAVGLPLPLIENGGRKVASQDGVDLAGIFARTSRRPVSRQKRDVSPYNMGY